jgi:DNA-binding NarL/FixJ family response regulator
MSKPISIFLVDDHRVFSQSFESYIHTQGDFIWAGSGVGDTRTVNEILRLRPDILLLDYHLSAHTGLDVLEILRSKGFPGYIILLTMNRDPHVKIAVKTVGVNGFVSKETDGVDLLNGIRQLFLGEIDFLELTPKSSSPSVNLYQLTAQEKYIADLVCAGLESEEIANQLHISIHTVNTHRRKILSKTHSENFVQVCLKIKSS